MKDLDTLLPKECLQTEGMIETILAIGAIAKEHGEQFPLVWKTITENLNGSIYTEEEYGIRN